MGVVIVSFVEVVLTRLVVPIEVVVVILTAVVVGVVSVIGDVIGVISSEQLLPIRIKPDEQRQA
jgi:hypothetical protein